MRTVTRRSLLVVGLLLPAQAALAEAARPIATSDVPGHLFFADEAVVFKLAGAVEGYRVLDYGGKTMTGGDATSNAIRLGKLLCGYYELHLTYQGKDVVTPFGVVSRPRASRAGRINVDGATAWLEHKRRWSEIARILRRMGIAWVRERLSWGQVEPRRGEFRWGKYDAVAQAMHAEGIHVYQIFHDSPGWSRPGKNKADTRNPDDLRDVYRFTKTASRHYSEQIQAWEVWNEPDIGFWPDLSDRFAGLHKAAYLGIRAGNPRATVLLGSLCRGPSPFADRLLGSGAQDYFEVYNVHTYSRPKDYTRVIGQYLEVAARHGVQDRPVWLTEAGIRLRHTPEGRLTAADRKRQAEYVPKSVVMSLACGVDRHFVFVFPHYLERGIQFGLLHPDLSPRPAVLALATAVRVLGEARYLGALDLGADVDAHVFDTGESTVACIWSQKEQPVTVPVGAEAVEIVALLGRVSKHTTSGGTLRMKIGPEARYVLGLDRARLTELSGTPRSRGKRPANEPCKIVVRGYAKGLGINKGRDHYLIGPQTRIDYEIEVCNFDETRARKVALKIEAPDDWRREPPAWEGTLGPMGRELLPVTIRPSDVGLTEQVARVTGTADGEAIAPSLSAFIGDATKLPSAESKSLYPKLVPTWQANVPRCGTMKVVSRQGDVTQFEIRFDGRCDRWAYPILSFPDPRDLSRFDGIAVTYRCTAEDKKTAVRLQLVETGGSAYLMTGEYGPSAEWRRAVFQFSQARYGEWSRPDENNRLDLAAIARLLFGCNTKGDRVVLEVKDVSAVRFRRPGK